MSAAQAVTGSAKVVVVPANLGSQKSELPASTGLCWEEREVKGEDGALQEERVSNRQAWLTLEEAR